VREENIGAGIRGQEKNGKEKGTSIEILPVDRGNKRKIMNRGKGYWGGSLLGGGKIQ